MQPFKKIISQVVPIPLNDIDTDMIIPAQYLTSISKEGYGENCFRRLRDEDKNFPLNQDDYKNSKILVAQHNFGCGSSREHAVWALMGWGFRVVIAVSFADIFKSNSGKNGMVLVELPEEVVMEIVNASESGEYQVSVDLESQVLTLPDGASHKFPYDQFRKSCILKGYDDLDYLMSRKKKIENFQKKREENLFYSTLNSNR
jgi:3-isopropylmalate/(R)-2-methylmalate dehydratase small subunit